MQEFIQLLEKVNYKGQLEKLKKKYRDKSILIYGAGVFFETINNNYDLSGLNIIGIADKSKTSGSGVNELYGYRAVKPEDIESVNPEVILVGVLNPIYLIESIKIEYNKKNVLPLVNKGRKEFFKEIMKI